MIRTILEKAEAVVMAAAVLPIWAFCQLLQRNQDLPDRDPADGDDCITSFEATEPARIEYRPTEDTLEAAANSPTEYNVYTERRVTIDPDRLEEWVRANYDDETRVHIQTKYGTDVYTRGEKLDHECPVCGDPALVVSRGGQREWSHTDRDEPCTLEEVDDGE
ncbi:hypothetical protein HTZ84_22280 [Haloterrigena sp. SYSU A558-1]|uniref:Uncharacterized protein n=1 Tax=Haloterrigena gelatinilytica TaxID=2741724 RepID=A0ABX2LFG5_9EURY|nr:hypothetical protein [Haloterrigena gelatinilytica]NUC74995.1 hypothetical protein [Haloterrigena gelatinilytica]